MESLLRDLKQEVPSIPKEKILAFVYEEVGADIEKLEANSGCRANRDGEVELHFFTTSEADIVEVRLEITDEWKHSEDGTVRDFYVRAACHYDLLKQELRELRISNLRLSTTEPDGSVRAVIGSYVNLGAITIYGGGPPPIQPKQERLG